jgi:hypothetical protein
MLLLSVTSNLAPKVLPLICFAALSALCLLLEQTTTVAPLFSANSFDIAKPIPCVEPVTMASLLLRDNYNEFLF